MTTSAKGLVLSKRLDETFEMFVKPFLLMFLFFKVNELIYKKNKPQRMPRFIVKVVKCFL